MLAALIFDYSPYFIILCVLIGAAYAFFLYQKNGPWNIQTRYLLAFFRFATASLIAFLILGPLLRQFSNTIEKASYVILVDNSMSVTETMDSSSIGAVNTALSDLKSGLQEQGYEVKIRGLDESEELIFDQKSTNLSSTLDDIEEKWAGTHLAGVILASDGIYNRGTSPTYKNYSFPVYTVGLGDSIPKADLNLQNIFYNKIAYQGNKFPLLVEIYNNGFDNGKTRLYVSHKGKVIDEKVIDFKNQSLVQANFTIEATEIGPQHYVIGLDPLQGEFSQQNNYKHVYVDIIDGKEKILLVANAPHPDIKALRSVIEKNDNYEFSMFIPGVGTNDVSILDNKYDLTILYQLPSFADKVNLESIIENQNSLLYILGSRSSIPRFNQVNTVVNIEARLSQKDEVTPVFNRNFSKFTYEEGLEDIFSSWPPVETPFGNYELQAGGEILLYQRFGSVNTEKPLIAVSDLGERKTGVMLGDNFWRWRMQEYALKEEHKSFDQLFTKLIQYLSSKEDKRKFKVYPVNREFTDNEPVIFDTEVYNDIYEKIYNQKIDLSVTSEEGETSSFSYVNSASNSQFRINRLPQGTYSYSARTTLNGKVEQASGTFIVSALQVESLNLTADFSMLRSLSNRTGGDFYHKDDIPSLRADLTSEKVPDIIHTSENFLPLLNLEWLLALIIVLISAEWFIRKYQGSY